MRANSSRCWLSISGSPVSGKWDEKAQEDYALKFYRVCFAHSALRAITWWDLCDQGAWLKGAGLLRADHTPKPAYEALRRLIHEEWHTRVEGQSNQAGRFACRGFYGQYRVTVSIGSQTWTRDLYLARVPTAVKAQEWTVKLTEVQP